MTLWCLNSTFCADNLSPDADIAVNDDANNNQDESVSPGANQPEASGNSSGTSNLSLGGRNNPFSNLSPSKITSDLPTPKQADAASPGLKPPGLSLPGLPRPTSVNPFTRRPPAPPTSPPANTTAPKPEPVMAQVPAPSVGSKESPQETLHEDSTQHELQVLPELMGVEGLEDDVPTQNDEADEAEASSPEAFVPDPSWGTSDPSMETIDEIPLGALGALSGDTTAEEGDGYEEDDFAEDATQIYMSGLNPAPESPGVDLPGPPGALNAPPQDASVLGSGFHRQPSQVSLPQAAPDASGIHAQPAPLTSSGLNQSPQGFSSGFHQAPHTPAPTPETSDFYAQPSSLGTPEENEELSEDFAAQKTEILQSHFEEEEVTPKLIAIQGPVKGQEFFVSGLRATGGRGENNTLVIADMAMSRNHFEIIRNPDNSYLIRDLNSANGCFLNGTQIKEAAIFNQDRLEIGKSVLEFACAPAKAKPHRHLIPVAGVTLDGVADLDDKTRMAALQIDESTRLFTRITVIAGSVSLLLMLVLVGLVITQSKDGNTAPSPTRPSSNSTAQGYFLKGVDAVSAREWDLAESFFKRAQSEDASLPAAAQLERVKSERNALSTLNKGKELVEQNKIEEARAEIDKIPTSSVYYKEAQQLTRLQRLDKLSTLLQSAQTMLTNDALDDARAKVDQILKESPEHEGAQELRKKIDARADELKALALADEAKKAAVATPPSPFETTSDRPNTVVLKPNNSGTSEAQAYSLYKQGKFTEAATAFNALGDKRSKSRARASRDMQSNYRPGKSAYDAGQWSRAVSKLSKARRADSRAGGHYKRKIATMLAGAYGKQGQALLRSKKYKEARAQLLKGLKLDRTNADLSALSRGLETTATRLYIQAVNKKRSNPDVAIDLCRTIMRMVPSSSSSYKKAQRLVFEM